MRSVLMGKVLVIGLLCGVMLVVFAMVRGLIHERERYQQQLQQDVGRSQVQPQRLITPFIRVPEQWQQPCVQDPRQSCAMTVWRQIVPLQSQWQGKALVDGQRYRRNAYRVLAWQAQWQLDTQYPLQQAEQKAQAAGHSLDWRRAQLWLGVTDLRGLDQLPVLVANGQRHVFEFAENGAPDDIQGQWVTLPLGGLLASARPAQWPVQLQLALNGIQRLSLVPLGQGSQVRLQSNWPHPHFDGDSLPSQKTLTARDFSAQWHTSYLNVENNRLLNQPQPATPSQARLADPEGLISPAASAQTFRSLSVTWVNPVSVYTLTDRSLKYAMLLVLMTFGTFFLVEILHGWRVHPIQYGLVGAALAVFYGLVLSFGEVVGFAGAYLGGSLACVGLIGWYVAQVLGGWRRGLMLAAGLSALYGTTYLLLSSEDYTLMMGSVLVFVLIAVVMFVTRRVDWYGLDQPGAPVLASAAPDCGGETEA